jgi:hypothetical protein
MNDNLPFALLLPPWVEAARPMLGVFSGLFCAWVFIYRLDWINRSWQVFGLRIDPTGASDMGAGDGVPVSLRRGKQHRRAVQQDGQPHPVADDFRASGRFRTAR